MRAAGLLGEALAQGAAVGGGDHAAHMGVGAGEEERLAGQRERTRHRGGQGSGGVHAGWLRFSSEARTRPVRDWQLPVEGMPIPGGMGCNKKLCVRNRA